MIGIYKITNKLNGKSYIGQSIHCGKRFDEHEKGHKQLIDQVIEIDGIENYTFEILKIVKKEELNYWEDYYILQYNTMYPNGYNKRWNCSSEVRNNIKINPFMAVEQDTLEEQNEEKEDKNYENKALEIWEQEEKWFQKYFCKDMNDAVLRQGKCIDELRKCKSYEEQDQIYLKYIEIYKTLL